MTAHTEGARPDPTRRASGRPGLQPGLVPVAFSFARQRVRLLDLRGIDQGEPALRKSVERWTAEHPEQKPVELPWSEFLALARETPVPPPAGFIFNVARCGSTLLANMLAAPVGCVALKESSTVGLLQHRWRTADTLEEREHCEQLLTVTVPLYSRLVNDDSPANGLSGDDAAGGGSVEPRLFVKPHSLALVSADLLLRLFPETPAAFLWRDPAEVVASMLAKPVYGGLYDTPRQELATIFPSLGTAPVTLSPAAFNAHLWRSPVEAALALPSERLLLVDYADLAGRPEATVERLLRWFRAPPSPETTAQMLATMAVYSKDPSGTVRFEPSGAHHRPPLTAEQLADVQTIVGDLPARLQAWRRTNGRHSVPERRCVRS